MTTDWNDPAVKAHISSIMTALIWVSVGCSFMETIRFASFDWQIITGKRHVRLPQIFYLTTKVMWWAYILAVVITLYTLTKIDCRASMIAVETLMGFVAFSSSMVLACRTLSVVDSPAVKASVAVGALAMLAAWMAGAADVSIEWVPSTTDDSWADGSCNVMAVPARYSIKYCITVAFDFYVLIITTVQVARKASGTRLGSVLASQGIVYFTATAVANLVVCTLTLLQKTPLLSISAAVPSACICVMASTRLYVQLTHDAQPDSNGVRSTSHHSSAGEKIFSYMRRATSYGLGSSGTSTQQRSSHTAESYGGFPGNAHPFDLVLPPTPLLPVHATNGLVTPGTVVGSPLQERTGYFDSVPTSSTTKSYDNNDKLEKQ